jgi:hypothetical protein
MHHHSPFIINPLLILLYQLPYAASQLLTRLVSYLRGIVGYLRGIVSYLRGIVGYLHGIVSCLRGIVSYLCGIVSYLRGIVSCLRGIVGYLRGIVGNLRRSQLLLSGTFQKSAFGSLQLCNLINFDGENEKESHHW